MLATVPPSRSRVHAEAELKSSSKLYFEFDLSPWIQPNARLTSVGNRSR